MIIFPCSVFVKRVCIQSFSEFPAGILQGAFFSNDRPRYLNYGAIGFVIGHEITHGFDDQGRQFDKNGNLVDWWAKDTEAKFLKKAQCIIDQYGNYTAKEVGINVRKPIFNNSNLIMNAPFYYRRYASCEMLPI